MLYLALKTIHVLAVVIFLGNITVGAFWKAFADKTGKAPVMAHTIDGIIRADRIFTIPAIVVLLLAGFATAGVGHYSILGTGWILWGIGLFVVSGIAFGPIARAQRALLAVAQTGLQTAEQQRAYEALSRQWNLYGTIATAAPFAALVIMVLKPSLPAFH
jgi:uncharacterized membrane protein